MRVRNLLAVLAFIAIGAGAILAAPGDDTHALPASALAPAGRLPAVVHEHGPETVAAYQAALDHPATLAAVPCLCGCMPGLGHRNNLDCYIEAEYPAMTVYTTHGVNCLVCQVITRDAIAGAAAGMDAAALRAMIVDRYGGS